MSFDRCRALAAEKKRSVSGSNEMRNYAKTRVAKPGGVT